MADAVVAWSRSQWHGGRGAGGRGNSGRGGGNHGKGTAGGSDSGRNTKTVSNKPKKPLTCFRCHEEGHFARECPNDSENEEEHGSAYATQQVQCLQLALCGYFRA